ncbi:hypothetical protein L195_g006269 [Trifolium pratense]|uniref:Uncharacterized protein n=1 Tax=Trifolium pratense TaxID=57577 RepID=A0A2K3P342_TRIPR|nr:hypothetical protein L195_g006269 [Trifolium pratense]
MLVRQLGNTSSYMAELWRLHQWLCLARLGREGSAVAVMCTKKSIVELMCANMGCNDSIKEVIFYHPPSEVVQVFANDLGRVSFSIVRSVYVSFLFLDSRPFVYQKKTLQKHIENALK